MLRGRIQLTITYHQKTLPPSSTSPTKESMYKASGRIDCQKQHLKTTRGLHRQRTLTCLPLLFVLLLCWYSSVHWPVLVSEAAGARVSNLARSRGSALWKFVTPNPESLIQTTMIEICHKECTSSIPAMSEHSYRKIFSAHTSDQCEPSLTSSPLVMS